MMLLIMMLLILMVDVDGLLCWQLHYDGDTGNAIAIYLDRPWSSSSVVVVVVVVVAVVVVKRSTVGTRGGLGVGGGGRGGV